MPSELDQLLVGFREKYDAARRDQEFYGQILREIEAALTQTPGSRRQRKGSNGAERTKTGTKRRGRRAKSEVSASDAVRNLLAGCKMGLPSSEILQYVSTTFGHQTNSIRTTLYNLKKKGDIVQDEQRVYHHSSNV